MKTRPLPGTLEAALTPKEAAARLHISVRELAELRHTGTGPDHLRLGARTVRYLGGDLTEWRDRLSGTVAS
jgi:hypothetical protein